MLALLLNAVIIGHRGSCFRLRSRAVTRTKRTSLSKWVWIAEQQKLDNNDKRVDECDDRRPRCNPYDTTNGNMEEEISRSKFGKHRLTTFPSKLFCETFHLAGPAAPPKGACHAEPGGLITKTCRCMSNRRNRHFVLWRFHSGFFHRDSDDNAPIFGVNNTRRTCPA